MPPWPQNTVGSNSEIVEDDLVGDGANWRHRARTATPKANVTGYLEVAVA